MIRLTIFAACALIAVPNTLPAQCHLIPPVPVDESTVPGVEPDGVPEFSVSCELLEVAYEGVPAGIQLSTLPLSPLPFPTYRVTVSNLSAEWLRSAVLTVENYGVFYGDPTGQIFLHETVWNPPALAGADTPAYPLDDIEPGGSNFADVVMIPGFELPVFDGEVDAESIGFESSAAIPGFSDASVLAIPEPATLEVAIDIKPKAVNPASKAMLPVAILGSEMLDVHDVVQASLALEGSAPKEKGNAEIIGNFGYLNGDGHLDLLVLFPAADLNLEPDAVEAELTGVLLDGTEIFGSDAVRLVGGRPGPDAMTHTEHRVVPEPAAASLLAFVTLALIRRKRRK